MKILKETELFQLFLLTDIVGSECLNFRMYVLKENGITGGFFMLAHLAIYLCTY